MRTWDLGPGTGFVRPLTLATEDGTVEPIFVVVDDVVAATDGIVFAGDRARLQAGQVSRRWSGGPGGRGCAAGISLSRWRRLDDLRLSVPGVQKRIVWPETLGPTLTTSHAKAGNHQNDAKSSHSFGQCVRYSRSPSAFCDSLNILASLYKPIIETDYSLPPRPALAY